MTNVFNVHQIRQKLIELETKMQNVCILKGFTSYPSISFSKLYPDFRYWILKDHNRIVGHRQTSSLYQTQHMFQLHTRVTKHFSIYLKVQGNFITNFGHWN